MLRISRDDMNNRSVSLRLEGKMTGPWVDETDRICEAIIGSGQRLRIDLSQVTFVDRAGVKLLGRLKKRNAVLDHCSPLLRAQLRLP